jgi:hypothetical protein
MRTNETSEEVSSPPAQRSAWGVKIGGEHGGGTEKRCFGISKWLANPRDERIIAETTSKT